ncbi:hypothetical protein W823_22900 [Williamsia sp. D3]|nr:hypothetical protein W823_22900 [Williamsia sp. D3]PVY22403.1 hypothetical protein C7458_13011 [Williamsia marianensis]
MNARNDSTGIGGPLAVAGAAISGDEAAFCRQVNCT